MSLPEAPLDRAPPAPQVPVLDASGRRGRALFFAGLGLYAVWELTVLGLQAYFGSPLVMQSVARVVPGLGLFFFAWRGRPWAAILLTVAFTVVCGAGWHRALAGDLGWIEGSLVTVVPTLLGLYGIALQAPPVRRYLAFQRAND